MACTVINNGTMRAGGGGGGAGGAGGTGGTGGQGSSTSASYSPWYSRTISAGYGGGFGWMFRAAHQVNVEMQVGPLPETIATTVCTERTVKRLFSLSRQVILVFMVRFLLRHMFRHKP